MGSVVRHFLLHARLSKLIHVVTCISVLFQLQIKDVPCVDNAACASVCPLKDIRAFLALQRSGLALPQTFMYFQGEREVLVIDRCLAAACDHSISH